MTRNDLPGRDCRSGEGTRSMFCGLAAMMAILAAPTLPRVYGDPWTTSTQIPVVVNIYNSSATPAQVDKAIEEANKLLKQVDTKLVVVKTNNPPGGGSGDNGDGRFTRTERDAMRTYGGKELKKLKNEKGIKISFGQDPKAEAPGTTSGISAGPTGGPPNGKAGDPTIIIKRTTDADTGNTIAHELGHVMGITGDYNNPDRIMDSKGRGSKFSAAEIAQMKKFKYKFGKCSTQWSEAYPATKDKTQFGATTDTRGDAGGKGGVEDYYDLHQIYLTSAVEFDEIDAEIDVAGVLPEDEWIDATYSLGFDIDADVGTGTFYGGYYGIDRIVYVHASGQINMGTFVLVGVVEDTMSGFVEPLPESPEFATITEIGDYETGTEPAGTGFYFNIPKSLLDLSAMDAPVVATAGMFGTLYDTTDDLTFDSDRWADDPTLTTFGTGVPEPGSYYSYTIEGLQANSPFQLYLDDAVVASGTLSSTGSMSGGFLFPVDVSNTEMHFLTAQDETGEFAYSMTCPKACATCLGDFDGSDVVDIDDIPPYIDILVDGFSPIGNPACGETDATSLLDGLGIATMVDLVLANGGSGTPCPEGICVMPGEDCWSTPCNGSSQFGFIATPIPADFFGPGSDPFEGQVSVGGATSPLGADTRVLRIGELCFLDSASQASTPIEIVEMDLVSCSPITITYNGGLSPELWDVAVDLSSIPGPFGSMLARRTHVSGGTFDSTLFVQPRFTFTKVSDPIEVREFDTGVEGMPPIQLDTMEAPWLFDEQSGNACDPNFAPGYQEAAETGTCCTEVCRSAMGGPASHTLCAYPPYCMDPCFSGLVIPKSIDCFQTPCGRTEYDFCEAPLPADFFGPGSEPFDGVIKFRGMEPWDTVFWRHSPLLLSDTLPSSDEAIMQLEFLDLVGCEPLMLMVGGVPTTWEVRLELSGVLTPPGLMVVTRTHENGGTFTADFKVQPRFTFTQIEPIPEERIWDTGVQGLPPSQFMTVGPVPWVLTLEAGSTVFPCVSAQFIPGVEENPPGGPQCSRPIVMSASHWLHEMYAPYSSVFCENGACYLPGGGCVLTADESMCVTDLSGQYMGDGTTCDDWDGDNLADVFESNKCCYGMWTGEPWSTGTNPFTPDTDGDGLLDGDEILGGTDPCNPAG